MSTIVRFGIQDIAHYKLVPGAEYRITSPSGIVIQGVMNSTGSTCFLATEPGKEYTFWGKAPGLVEAEHKALIPIRPWYAVYLKLSSNPKWTGSIGVGVESTPCDPDAQPDEPPLPPPPPIDSVGPNIIECVFPTLSLNFISVMSGLASWIGCILHNIITILKWFVDWILHFPDHLDAWISRLFGVDPSLPFFDEVMKKIDVWISGKFGVDPALPFWEELVKKALAWIGGVLDAAAEERMRIRGWK